MNIIRCNKVLNNFKATCSNIAKYRIIDNDRPNRKLIRCCEHAAGFINAKERFNIFPLKHDFDKIFMEYKNLIGNTIYSRYHKKYLTIKFLKKDNFIFMAQDKNNKWYAVYREQIK